MSKFKIGDRVRRINDDFGSMKVGDIGIVEESVYDTLVLVGDSHSYISHNFELLPTFTIEIGTFYRTRSGKPTGRVTVGDTGFEAVVDGRVRIYDAAGGAVHGSPELDIVEVWTPKVGDRVRMVKDGLSTTGAVGKTATIAAWSDGEHYKWEKYLLDIDPPVNYRTVAVSENYTQATIDCFEPLPVSAPQPAIKPEAGRCYETRDGRKVGPMGAAEEWLGGFYDQGCRITGQRWEKDGSFIRGQISNLDLIAEWQETTNVGAQVDTLAEEYGPARVAAAASNDNAAKPKFKVGDRVEIIRKTGGRMPDCGTTGEVTDNIDGYVVETEHGAYGYDEEDLAPENDTTLHIKFTSDFSELDAAILVRKKKLKKLIKLARKAGIDLREAA